ncbi:FtsX-like permease family protein, partial [Clostridioides difficile]|uniref:FtsX-like permease family protein n=1 Tax=Clostridioides difficile TaxID=1496 RepID=UPI003F8D14C4
TYTSLHKQYRMMGLILKFYKSAQDAIKQNVTINDIIKLSVLETIILLGSIFLIYNSFNMSLNERTHQFGILSSVGATAKQLRNSVLF